MFKSAPANSEHLERRTLFAAIPYPSLSDLDSEISELFPLGGSFARIDQPYTSQAPVMEVFSGSQKSQWDLAPFSLSSNDSVEFVGTVGAKALLVKNGQSLASKSLWITDGTNAGTVKLASFAGTLPSGMNARFAKSDGKYWVVLNSELVVTDGTAQGTKKLRLDARGKVALGASAIAARSGGAYISVVGDEYVDDESPIGSRYRQIWSVNTTFADTQIVEEERMLSYEASEDFYLNDQMRAAAGGVFISSRDSQYSTTRELRFDKGKTTAAVTVDGDFDGSMYPVNGGLVYIDSTNSKHVLRRSTGNTSVEIKSLNAADGSMSLAGVVGTKVLFRTFKSAGEWTLWATDGTSSGTVALHTQSTYNYHSDWRANQDGTFLFIALVGEADALFQTDGTPSGTRVIEPSLRPSAIYESPAGVFVDAGRDGVGSTLYRLEAGAFVSGFVSAGAYSNDESQRLEDVFVWLDTDKDGKRDGDEPQMRTDERGYFEFLNAEAGQVIRIDTESGALAVRKSSFEVADTGESQTVNFVVTTDARLARATGIVKDQWTNILGTNSIDALEGVRVYVDLDADRKFDAAEPNGLTDTDGIYKIYGIPATAKAAIRVVPRAGSALVASPAAIQFSSGKIATSDIALTPYFTVSGRIYNDQNANGQQDKGEPSLPGALLKDGLTSQNVIAGERGVYSIRFGLSNATASVSASLKGFRQTGNGLVPGGTKGQTYIVNVGLTSLALLQLGVFADEDGRAKSTNDRGAIEGTSVWADINGNGRQEAGEVGTPSVPGYFGFSALPPNVPLRLHIDLPTGYYLIDTSQLPAKLRSGAVVGAQVYATKFATVAGKVFIDKDGDNKPERGETRLVGVRAYVDLDQDGSRDRNEPWAFTDAAGNFSISNVVAGEHVILVSVPEGYRARLRPTAVAARPGRTSPQANFGLTTRSSLRATVFVDRNDNSAFDKGEGAYFGHDTSSAELIGLSDYLNYGFGGVYDGIARSTNEFAFDSVPAGEYTLRIGFRNERVGQRWHEITINIGGAVNQVLRIKLPSNWL